MARRMEEKEGEVSIERKRGNNFKIETISRIKS